MKTSSDLLFYFLRPASKTTFPHWSLSCSIFQKNTVFNSAVSLKHTSVHLTSPLSQSWGSHCTLASLSEALLQLHPLTWKRAGVKASFALTLIPLNFYRILCSFSCFQCHVYLRLTSCNFDITSVWLSKTRTHHVVAVTVMHSDTHNI